MDSERQFQKDDEVDVFDELGYPLYMTAVVLTDEAVGDTHVRIEYSSYPGGLGRIPREQLRLVRAAHG